jgi:hypothetical protein
MPRSGFSDLDLDFEMSKGDSLVPGIALLFVFIMLAFPVMFIDFVYAIPPGLEFR